MFDVSPTFRSIPQSFTCSIDAHPVLSRPLCPPSPHKLTLAEPPSALACMLESPANLFLLVPCCPYNQPQSHSFSGKSQILVHLFPKSSNRRCPLSITGTSLVSSLIPLSPLTPVSGLPSISCAVGQAPLAGRQYSVWPPHPAASPEHWTKSQRTGNICHALGAPKQSGVFLFLDKVDFDDKRQRGHYI